MATIKKNGQSRLDRGTLTRSSIIEAALRIMDESGESKLTFARLGQHLGSSPSAMYRHFSNRDEIIEALGDELIRISLDGYAPSASWEDSLWDLAVRAWRTYELHPAIASQTYFRVTRGPHELKAVDAILQALAAAGLSEDEAVTHYHLFAMTVLAQSADHAAKLAAMKAVEVDPAGRWEQVYVPRDPDEAPHYWAVRDKLRSRDDYALYRTQIELVIESVRRATAHEVGATEKP
ncbi:helix-turn-helix transcriptional regulator [Cellulosimicrobium funkei]|nr:helix-turn-helix transcriptional regulator [Cellulosimicrobium funkei]